MNDFDLNALLKEKNWTNTDLARLLRTKTEDQTQADHDRAVVNLSKNIAKWCAKISRPTYEDLELLGQLSNGRINHKSFIRPRASSPFRAGADGKVLPKKRSKVSTSEDYVR